MKDFQVSVDSITGRRELNEDSVLDHTLSDGRRVLAVADGMGGHTAGEVASGLAIEALTEGLEQGMDLGAAVTHANARVHGMAQSQAGKAGMGTTLTVALVEDTQYWFANVGDSRGYEITAQGIRQVTEDHSFVAEAIRRGVDEAEALQSDYKDALLRAIGTHAEVEVDVFGPFPTDRDFALLMCSDGLYKTLRDRDMGEIFTTTEDLDQAVGVLIQTSYDQGSDDNISVVVAEFGSVPRENVLGGGDAADGTLIMDEPFQPPVEETPVPAETTDDSLEEDERVPPLGDYSGSGSAVKVVGAVIVIVLAAVTAWMLL